MMSAPSIFLLLLFTYPTESTIVYVLRRFELFIENQVTLYKDISEKSKLMAENRFFYSPRF